MKYFKALALTAFLGLSTGCLVVPVPMHVGTRGPIRKHELGFLEKGAATREDVLLHLGKPEYSSLDERYLDYSWIGAWDVGVLGPAGSGEFKKQECHTLRFHLDERGKVDDLYTSSYKPDATLSDSGECHFKSYNSRRLNIRGLPAKEAPADRSLFIEGKTTRAEVLQQMARWGVDLDSERIFWMRWFSTSSDMSTQSDLEALTSGAKRGKSWSRQKYRNLLVEFDERGVVVGVRKVKDKDIVRELVDWARRSGYRPADPSLTSGNSYSAWTKGNNRRIGSISVDADSIRIWDSPWRKRFRVSLYEIKGLEFRSEPEGLCFVLKLKNKTAWGDEIYFKLNKSETIRVLVYLAEHIP
jgi:hypothetical protein